MACLDKNETLREELRAVEDKDAKKSKYFDPMTADPCLSECRAQFYFVYKKLNRYFTTDKGFLIESSHKYSLQ